ncbi:MAG: 50S ribosomal protein L11 methyltransferase [Halothiobacillaceae bacterium]
MADTSGWVQMSVAVPEAQVEAAEEALLAAGALSVTLLDTDDVPVLEPAPGETPLWPSVRVIGLFAADQDPAAVMGSLHNALPVHLLDSFDWQELPDQDWTRKWMDEFQPQRFGQRLWVVPGWCTPPDPTAVNLMLDPGLAFGTGNHPTTALCLGWLESQVRGGERVLDFGCGSGILAIAALKLGADTARGVDIDPQALTATADNAAANGIEPPRLVATLPEGLAPDEGFDLVVANILANPLIELAPTLAAHLVPGGRFALSGVLREQADAVADACRQAGLVIAEIESSGDWVLIHGRRD